MFVTGVTDMLNHLKNNWNIKRLTSFELKIENVGNICNFLASGNWDALSWLSDFKMNNSEFHAIFKMLHVTCKLSI
jgi:hypothetical protein